MKKELLRLLPALALTCAGLALACGRSPGKDASEPAAAARDAQDASEAAAGEIEGWLDVYYPEAAESGYTLLLYRRRFPTLIDMNGRAVHAWPQVRVAGRARLLADGSILVIAQDGAVRQFSWDGEPLWEFRLEGEDFPHHDLIELASGSRLVLAHDVEERLDYLVEVSRDGAVLWRWDAAEHLAGELPRAGDIVNRTHVNSIHELGENPWWSAGDARFRPGNILISARNLNAVYLIDKITGAVVWRYYGELDHQHEALMIPRDHPRAGHILVFNNGLRDLYGYRESSILEIDPTSGSEVWSYRSPSFFSSTGGTQQSLANGNVLVTSSRGGRIFEIDRGGKIVWQLAPSYNPMRVERYAYDHTPQLAALPVPAETRVERRNPRRHIDEDLYTFALPHQTRKIKSEGQEVTALKESEVCRRLLLPERPDLVLGWGVKPRKNQPARQIQVALEVTVEPLADDAATAQVLFSGDETLAVDGESELAASERKRLELAPYALQPVELCLAARGPGDRPAPPIFFWAPPTIRSGHRAGAEEAEEVDPAVKAVQDKHLKALGYID